MGGLDSVMDDVREYKKLQLISEMAPVRERVKLFEHKYKLNFEDFEKELERQPEAFEVWDDYIEWKAYQAKLTELRQAIGNIKNVKDPSITQ